MNQLCHRRTSLSSSSRIRSASKVSGKGQPSSFRRYKSTLSADTPGKGQISRVTALHIKTECSLSLPSPLSSVIVGNPGNGHISHVTALHIKTESIGYCRQIFSNQSDYCRRDEILGLERSDIMGRTTASAIVCQIS